MFSVVSIPGKIKYWTNEKSMSQSTAYNVGKLMSCKHAFCELLSGLRILLLAVYNQHPSTRSVNLFLFRDIVRVPCPFIRSVSIR